jgi:Tfp pilus assembly protein PilP
MKNKTIAITGALLIGGLLTFNSVAFADVTDANSTKLPQRFTQVRERIQGKIGDFGYKGQRVMMVNPSQDWSVQLKELVAAGTITQATADKVQTYVNEQHAAMKAEMEKMQSMTAEERKTYLENNKIDTPKRLDLFSSMVEKAILTQTEADAIKEKLNINHKGNVMISKERLGKDWSTELKELVAAGTITQSSADKIQTYIAEQQTAAKAEMDKVKSMTEAERKAYFESKKSDITQKHDLLSTLVEKGIITQTEADTVKAAHQANRDAQRVEQQAQQQENRISALNKLVESNVITAEQVTKINEFISTKQAAREAEMEKVKAMTQEERTAYLKNNVENKTNMLSQLVTDNVLTQEQADAIQKVLPLKGFSMGFGRNIERGFGFGKGIIKE